MDIRIIRTLSAEEGIFKFEKHDRKADSTSFETSGMLYYFTYTNYALRRTIFNPHFARNYFSGLLRMAESYN